MFEPFAICAKQSGKTFPNPLILSPKDALGNANERLQALGEADVEVQLATGVSKGKVYEEKDGERVGESRGAGVVLMLVKRRERRGDRGSSISMWLRGCLPS